MGTNHGAVDHMLPVIGQSQVYQTLQQGIPHALFNLDTESDDGFPGIGLLDLS